MSSTGCRKNSKWLPIEIIGGILVIVVYIGFLLLSLAYYPPPYSPASNWLSDLGSPSQNPSGSHFYNIGCILTALCLFVFDASLVVWRTGQKKRDIELMISQILGCFPAFSLIMAAIFNIDTGELHSLWSAILVITFGYFFVMLGITLFTHSSFLRPIAIYGFTIAGINMVYGFGINTPWLEWVVIFMYLAFVGLIVLNVSMKLKSWR